MTTPENTKTLRVSPETHALVMEYARRIRGTVDEAVADLADESTVRIQMGDIQRARWERAAESMGLKLGDYIRLTVEGGMKVNAQMVATTYFNVLALCRAAQIKPAEMRTDTPNSAPQK